MLLTCYLILAASFSSFYLFSYFAFVPFCVFLFLFFYFMFLGGLCPGEPDKAILRLQFLHRYRAPLQPHHIVFRVRKQREKNSAKSKSGESCRQPWRPLPGEDVMHIPTRSPRTHGPGPNAPGIRNFCSFALLGRTQSGCSCISAAPSSCIFLFTKHQRSRFPYCIWKSEGFFSFLYFLKLFLWFLFLMQAARSVVTTGWAAESTNLKHLQRSDGARCRC